MCGLDWSAIAAWVTAGIALVALVLAYRQIKSSEKASREATALQAWSDYLTLCVEHPEYSSHPMVRPLLEGKSAKDIQGQLTTASEKYLWLISMLLLGCEKVLLSEPTSAEWRATMVAQIAFHWPSLAQLESSWGPGYEPDMRRLIHEGIEKGRVEYPDWQI